MNHIKTWMCRMYVIFIMLTHVVSAFGAFEYLEFGWSTATGNMKAIDCYWDQLVVHQARVGRAPPNLISIAYQKPFQGLDLQSGSIALQHGSTRQAFRHFISYFGDDVYREFNMSSATTWPVYPGLMLGLSVAYYRVSISSTVNQQNLSLSMSSGMVITENLQLGSVLGQLIQTNNGLVIPQEFHFGGQFKYGSAKLMAAFEKEAALPAELSIGMLLTPWTGCEFGFGYRELSGLSTAGWRCSLAQFAFYYIYAAHPVLPVSHGFGIEYDLP